MSAVTYCNRLFLFEVSPHHIVKGGSLMHYMKQIVTDQSPRGTLLRSFLRRLNAPTPEKLQFY